MVIETSRVLPPVSFTFIFEIFECSLYVTIISCYAVLGENVFSSQLRSVNIDGQEFKYFNIKELQPEKYGE